MEMTDRLLTALSDYLNFTPRAVTEEMIKSLRSQSDLDQNEAFSMLLASHLGFDLTDRSDLHRYLNTFPKMVRPQDARRIAENPYYKTIRVPQTRFGAWELGFEVYQPFEAFVCGDFIQSDGCVLPQIGYFDTAFPYPCVKENGREWMTVTPNEIATMEKPIGACFGHVLAYGLGLGYFAFMAGQKSETVRITVVERDPAVIELFEKHLLPQFPCRDKIEVICADAFDFAQNEMAKRQFDVVFTDLWHDVSDGIALYQKMKTMEKFSPKSRFYYWIEDTMRYYL